MKTIGTNPTKASAAGPDFIEDPSAPKVASRGTGIGDLVGGQSAQTPEEIDFAQEEAHWRENHARQPFANGQSYENFGPAYRAGFEGYSVHGVVGKSFDETETELRERYESENGSPKVPWTIARLASHAAWHRSARKKQRG